MCLPVVVEDLGLTNDSSDQTDRIINPCLIHVSQDKIKERHEVIQSVHIVPFPLLSLERFLYYTTVRVSNKIFPSTYMEAVALTVKATQARQHQHSSLRLSCYLLMRAVAYLVK